MSLKARQYRNYLYQNQSHPENDEDIFWEDKRDSFLPVVLTLIPFLVMEYYVELTMGAVPVGLLFPFGYLLFWAFYYTYYKPNALEDHLTEPRKWDLMQIPILILGLAIWFVKVTVVELGRVMFLDRIFKRKKNTGHAHPGYQPVVIRTQQHRQTHQARQYQRPQPSRSIPILPLEVREALRILGLREGSSWAEIQHRYRELAKRYHPDLNQEITSAGRRFMLYDTAYRRIEMFRAKGSFARR